MPTQKFLKAAVVAVAVLAVLYVGLAFILAGSRHILVSPLTATRSSFNIALDQSSGSAGMVSPGLAPSAAKGAPMYAGESAQDANLGSVQSTAVNAGAAGTVDKKIIQTGDLNLKVTSADASASAIKDIAHAQNGGVIYSSFYQSSRNTKSGTISVQVPYQNFDATYEQIKKVATQVISESSNAQDITEQYVDLAARLKNAQAEEASFVALLNRSGKIEDILNVTREVARVRGEIEQLQAQIRYFDSRSDMSTITANLSEDVTIEPVTAAWRPWQVVKTSVKQLLTLGQSFIDGLIALVIVVLPMLVIYALIVWLIYLAGRKIYRHYTKRQ